MQVNIHQAKAKLSGLIDAVESGSEVTLARRNVPVARIVPITKKRHTRIGGLASRPYKMGEAFDNADLNREISESFKAY